MSSRTLTKYITTAELAEYTRTTQATVRYWRATGSGPVGIKVGRHVLYDLGVVDQWIAGLALEQSGVATSVPVGSAR